MRVCAITNVYNEKFNLPTWLNYYSSQIGAENCIVIDNGTDDGSTENLGRVGRINMPRTKFSDHTRASLISEIASSMLQVYDAVIYSDCDELLVADPTKFNGLVEFCEKMDAPAATAIGLNLYQHIAREAALDPTENILKQRCHAQFVSPMCKTLVIKSPTRWGPGFHSSSLPPHFSDLYLFHLRWIDVGECLKRLSITQKIEFSHAAHHHQWPIKQYLQTFQWFSERAISKEFSFTQYLSKLSVSKKADLYAFAQEITSQEIFEIPAAFRSAF